MTIYEETANGPAICLIGENRAYAIGDTAYKFQRQPKGLTLPTFAKGIPVSFIDGEFRPVVGVAVIKHWMTEVTRL